MNQYSHIISTMLLNLKEKQPLFNNVLWVSAPHQQKAEWLDVNTIKDGAYYVYDHEQLSCSMIFELHLTRALFAYMASGDIITLKEVHDTMHQLNVYITPDKAIDELLVIDGQIYQKKSMPSEQWTEMQSYLQQHNVRKNLKSEIEFLEKKRPEWSNILKRINNREDVYFLQMYNTLLEWTLLKKDNEALLKNIQEHEHYKKEIMHGYAMLSTGLFKGSYVHAEELQRLKREYDRRNHQLGQYQLQTHVINNIMQDIQKSDVFKQLSEWAHTKPMFGEKTRHLHFTDLSSSQLKVAQIFMEKEPHYKKLFQPLDQNMRYAI